MESVRWLGRSLVSVLLVLLIAVPIVHGQQRAESQPDIELLGVAKVGGDQRDRSGLTEDVGEGLPHNLFGGISAMDYLGHDNLFIALPDRGPKDGAVDWICRMHRIAISIPQSKGSGTPRVEIVATTMLNDGERPFPGKASCFEAGTNLAARLDPEGLRVQSEGGFFLSDEYGPHLLEFDKSGTLTRRLSIPKRYRIEHPGVSKTEENGKNRCGRQCNRGMEGLAHSSDGQKLYGLMQSPLLQDARRKASGKLTGRHCRLLEFDLKTESCREFVYRLDDASHKLNEILAINEDEFLVIERDGESGEESRFKQIMKISLRGASAIPEQVETLPPDDLPASIIPVAKSPFIDLLDERFGLTGAEMPEKIESLTFGPKLEDGRATLLVVSDNDFRVDQPTMIYVFAIAPERLQAEALTTR